MANYQEQRERDYQNTLVKRFQNELGYKYLGNWQYAKGATVNDMGKVNSPILDNEVRAFLKEQGRTEMQIEDVLTQLKSKARLGDPKMSSLIQCNTELYETLIMGIKSQPSPEATHEDVMLFDFEDINKNHFAIAEEVSYIDPLLGKNKRPDIVVYVNGIALAIIELKRSLVNYEEGIKQHLSNERDFIPSFFTTAQFTIASNDGVDFRYGTVGTPLAFWCKWKKDTNKVGEVLTEKESYSMFFNKENFMFFFRYGVLNDGGIKKVLRPHQVYAIKAAAARMPKKESGVIWHSQGSGKSLTMVALASYIRRNFQNPRVVVITDRKELDIQLANTFIKGGNKLHQAGSCSDLLETLNQGNEWLICSLIHKFGAHSTDDDAEKDESGTKVSLDDYLKELEAIISQKYGNNFSVKGENIFVFVDECHRTQSGRLHEAMRAIMGKEIMLIGFTGTPLLKKDKGDALNRIKNMSERTFGSYIHKYLHKQAVEDKVILDLQYEYRNVEQQITSKEKVDQKLAALTAGRELTPEQQLMIEERWATLERIYSTKERIERIGYSILDDVNYGLLKHDWCNAMLVAGSIYQAYRYYEFFSRSDLAGRCSVVTSYDPMDSDLANNSADNNKTTEAKYKYDWAKRSFADAGVKNAEEYEAWAKNIFTKQPAQMKLLIVVNKLLTGFDAPCATILYIDNEIKDHTLFQAVCRVNRLGEDIKDENGNVIVKTHKEFGRIIDFKNLFNCIEDVVTKFNDGSGFEGLDDVDIEGLLDSAVNKCKERLLAATEAYEGLKGIWDSKGLKDIDALADYYITEYDGEDPAQARRNIMYSITGGMVTAYNNMADYFSKSDFTPEQIERFASLSREAGTIQRKVRQKSGDDFDPRTLDPDMRQLLDQHIRAEDAETFIPSTADFSFLDLINDSTDTDAAADKAIQQAGGNANGAAEAIEGKARRVNTDWNSGDEEEQKAFSEKLQALLDKLKQNNATAREKVKALIEHIKSIKHGNDAPDGLTNKRSKALWNNRAAWHAPEDKDATIELIKNIDDFIHKNAGRNWQDPDSNASWDLRDDLQAMYPDMAEQDIYEIYRLASQNS
jgi:type I restriction enzyme R subunit